MVQSYQSLKPSASGAHYYYAVKGRWRPVALESFRALAGRHQAVIIEGAGSPAEINLLEGDFVNLGLAAEIGAPAIKAGRGPAAPALQFHRFRRF